jgi:hypothetical protein
LAASQLVSRLSSSFQINARHCDGYSQTALGRESDNTYRTLLRPAQELSNHECQYVDGYFYWGFSPGMVPHTKPPWSVINEAMAHQ